MITPYITFNGNCNEAMDFYKNVFKSDDPRIMPYGDYIPDGIDTPPKNLSEWILHAEMQICGTSFWFADDVKPVSGESMIKLTVQVPSSKEAKVLFDGLNLNANIELPPTETFYSTFHAALTDRFGVCWHIVAEEAPQA